MDTKVPSLHVCTNAGIQSVCISVCKHNVCGRMRTGLHCSIQYVCALVHVCVCGVQTCAVWMLYLGAWRALLLLLQPPRSIVLIVVEDHQGCINLPYCQFIGWGGEERRKDVRNEDGGRKKERRGEEILLTHSSLFHSSLFSCLSPKWFSLKKGNFLQWGSQ